MTAQQDLGETLVSGGETRIHLSGRMTVRIAGRRVEDALPGRQGRLLFAFLVAHRLRPTPRGELLDVLWPDGVPVAADSALNALLTKVRQVTGAASIAGKHEIQLVLPAQAWVDFEAAKEGLHRAESAVALHDWARAWGPARVALHIAARDFLPGHQVPWIAAIRQQLADMLLRSHECLAASSLGLGGPELAAAERSARRLIELAPCRESGYRFLMHALAARDNVGEALLVYERLRQVLRDELGVSPGAVTQALQRRLLQRPSLPT